MIFKEKTFELNGRKIVLRSPKIKEAKDILKTHKIITGETKFLTRYPDEIIYTIKDEEKFVRKHNNSKDSMYIAVFVNGKLAGGCEFNVIRSNARRFKHIAIIGIGILQKYSGFGLGTLMLQNLIEQIEQCGFEQVILEVAGENKRAQHLYKKFGFKEHGRLKKATKFDDGTIDDVIYMFKELNKK